VRFRWSLQPVPDGVRVSRTRRDVRAGFANERDIAGKLCPSPDRPALQCAVLTPSGSLVRRTMCHGKVQSVVLLSETVRRRPANIRSMATSKCRLWVDLRGCPDRDGVCWIWVHRTTGCGGSRRHYDTLRGWCIGTAPYANEVVTARPIRLKTSGQ
jgi:hypothetical protein